MPTIVLPIGSWCYRVKVSYLRLVLSLSPRMKSSLNLFFQKKTSIEKQLSYTESTIDSFESSNVEPGKSTRMRNATSLVIIQVFFLLRMVLRPSQKLYLLEIMIMERSYQQWTRIFHDQSRIWVNCLPLDTKPI